MGGSNSKRISSGSGRSGSRSMASSTAYADAIGIDLGTTNSCVAVFSDTTVEAIANEFGNKTTPSCVLYKDDEIIVGEGAVDQAYRNLGNTIRSAKRLIGRSSADPHFLRICAQHNYETTQEGQRPKLIVAGSGCSRKVLDVEQVSAEVLLKMKSLAEKRFGRTLTKAVVTVPAHFSSEQRHATLMAARIAGLSECTLLNEPTAAAIAYGLNVASPEPRKVLVYDLGGGTFDVSILVAQNLDFTTLATDGNTELGGDDFDNSIVDYFIEEFKKQHPQIQIDRRDDFRQLVRLRKMAEEAKKHLSAAMKTTVLIDSLKGGEDLDIEFTRSKFEELCHEKMDETIATVKALLDSKSLEPSDISDIVMVGGSSHIPYLRKKLKELFLGREPLMGVNPDEAIAYGAAVLAAKKSNFNRLRTLKFTNITPLSLGLQIRTNTMEKIIPKGTEIPCTKTRHFATTKDNQTTANILIYEGERECTTDNHFLGELRLTGLPEHPRGKARFEVTFSVDENGILQVTARGKALGNSCSVKIDDIRNRLTYTEVQKAIQDSKRFAKMDNERQKRRTAISQYEEFCQGVLASPKLHKLDEDHAENVQNTLHDALDWLKKHQEEEPDQITERLESLQKQMKTLDLS